MSPLVTNETLPSLFSFRRLLVLRCKQFFFPLFSSKVMESVSLLLLCCCCERQSLPDLLFFFPQFSSLWSVRGPPVSASVFLQLEPMRPLLQHSIESRWKSSYQSAAAAAASVTLTDRGRSFVLYFTPPFFHFCFFFPGVIIISIFHLPTSLLTSPVIQSLHLLPRRTVFNKSRKKGKNDRSNSI